MSSAQHDLDLHFRKKINDVFGAAIKFGVALLAAEPLHLGNAQALDADLLEGFLDLVELEGLDDGLDFFHGVLVLLARVARRAVGDTTL
jgi:hypothetical protein